MRFAVAAILFIVAVFGFFLGYASFSYILDIIYTSLSGSAPADAITDMVLLKSSFGILCSFVLVIIFIVFIMDSLSEEPETYWRE